MAVSGEGTVLTPPTPLSHTGEVHGHVKGHWYWYLASVAEWQPGQPGRRHGKPTYCRSPSDAWRAAQETLSV